MTAPEADNQIDERYVVPGLLRGLQILQTFTRDRQEQTVADMARLIGVTRSTAFRIVYTLEMAGFLRRAHDSRRYQLGGRVLELGYSFLAGKDLIEVATPILRRLRDTTSTSTHLAVREGLEVVYVARFQGNTSLISAMTVGSRLPAHATAPGRVLLAGLPLSEVVGLYEDFAFETFTPETPDSMAALISLVEKDRKDSTVISWGFYDANVASIASPIYGATGKREAAVSISCPINTFDRATFETRIVRAVEGAAAEISSGLGYRAAA
ncbi:IclR family transcriptional regulator [Sphingomonadaceae bacterium G21617-S1]|uniref:IclR family transcriptional regulator n=1 Tax=Rhizorhabdus sp. TaxID=1968843 RepID=UPI001983E801|nr:IclR family transcriptional regulator [Rhizorhabdus sp.]MBD3759267.1 IclR family transcriptional regulator [Rhizorhabdus sp.]MCZ4341958.1 IclR family transcriptional regulator [Sphingomonadaceae bacterium G21617-S1]